MKQKKYHYDYVKVRVTPENRLLLEQMVAEGKANTLSDALRLLAFSSQLQTNNASDTSQFSACIEALATVHNDLTKIITNGLACRIVHNEYRIATLERQVAEALIECAQVMRQFRASIRGGQ